MSYAQLRLNYNFEHGSAVVYRQLLAPLFDAWAHGYFFRWTVGKSWRNGRHILLTIDRDDHFFAAEMLTDAEARVREFLAAHPSAPYDSKKYLAAQRTLNELEAAGIDPSWVAANNSYEIWTSDVEALAAKYETIAQWQSVFDTDAVLLPIIIREWLAADDHERFVCELLILLACVYPPLPSGDPEVNEYNGFLSYYSHFRLWRHRLQPPQQLVIDRKFVASYANDRRRYTKWLAELKLSLLAPESRVRELTSVLLRSFLGFTRLATAGTIHSRSPYPRGLLAPADTLPDLHRRIFYRADGSANQFSPAFSAYRWLLNIVYRCLPLLDVSPLRRHYMNFALNELQREHLHAIHETRSAMLGACCH